MKKSEVKKSALRHSSLRLCSGSTTEASTTRNFTRRQTLRETREKCGSLAKTVVDAVILVDAGGNVELANDAALVLFGKAEAQITGKNLRDISERKRAAEALRESEENLRDFFDNANELIQSLGAEGNYLYVHGGD